MKILIACEESGAVRRAFRSQGHSAISCDILPARDGAGPDHHYVCDIREVLSFGGWEMVIAFPPCTDLCVSGARHFKEKQADGRQQKAIDFFGLFTRMECPWAIENPVGIMSTQYRKPDQIIQPWQFGHGETKATCLWLHGLPKLIPTNIVEGRHARIHRMAPSPNRSRDRSETYKGIADAMAEQWGKP